MARCNILAILASTCKYDEFVTAVMARLRMSEEQPPDLLDYRFLVTFTRFQS